MYIVAPTPPVGRPEHGFFAARVPWADHDARFARAFEGRGAWLAVECSKTAVAELLQSAAGSWFGSPAACSRTRTV